MFGMDQGSQLIGWTGIKKHCITALGGDSVILLHDKEEDPFLFFVSKEYLSKDERSCLLVTFSEGDKYTSLKKELNMLTVHHSLQVTTLESAQEVGMVSCQVPKGNKLDSKIYNTLLSEDFGMLIIDCSTMDYEMNRFVDTMRFYISLLVTSFCPRKYCFVFNVANFMTLPNLHHLTEFLNHLEIALKRMKGVSTCNLTLSSSLHISKVSFDVVTISKEKLQCEAKGFIRDKLLELQDIFTSVKEFHCPEYLDKINILLGIIEICNLRDMSSIVSHFCENVDKALHSTSAALLVSQYFLTQLTILNKRIRIALGNTMNVFDLSPHISLILCQILRHLPQSLALLAPLMKHLYKEEDTQHGESPAFSTQTLQPPGNHFNLLPLSPECTIHCSPLQSNKATVCKQCSDNTPLPVLCPTCSDGEKFEAEVLKKLSSLAVESQPVNALILTKDFFECQTLYILLHKTIEKFDLKGFTVSADTCRTSRKGSNVHICVHPVDMINCIIGKFSLVISGIITENYYNFYKMRSKVIAEGHLVFILDSHESGTCARSLKMFKALEDVYRSIEKTQETGISKQACCLSYYIKKLNQFQKSISDPLRLKLGTSLICETKHSEDSTGNIEYIAKLQLPRETFCFLPIKARYVCSQGPCCARTKDHFLELKTTVIKQTIKYLREIGKMDNELNPVQVSRFSNSFRREEWHLLKFCRARHLSEKVTVQKKIPLVWSNKFTSSGHGYALYSVSFTRLRTYEHSKLQKDYFRNGVKELGFFSVTVLPEIPQFILYDRVGEVRVKIEREVQYYGDCKINFLVEFNNYLYATILRMNHPESLKLIHKVLWLFLKQDADDNLPSIDYDYLFNIQSVIGDFCAPKNPPPIDLSELSSIQDAVIVPLYQAEPMIFYLSAVSANVRSDSTFPDQRRAATFAEYFKTRYDRSLSTVQPMLEVHHANRRLNFVIPRYEFINTQGVGFEPTYLPPELCSMHPIKLRHWKQFVLVPCILYRLCSFMLVDDFMSTFDTNFCQKDVTYSETLTDPDHALNNRQGTSHTSVSDVCERTCVSGGNVVTLTETSNTCFATVTCDNRVTNDSERENSIGVTSINNLFNASVGPKTAPSLSLALIALTSSDANDVLCNERLEFLGDAVLQFLTTFELFLHYKYDNECALSLRRSEIVSNWHLLKVGRRIDIESYILCEEFEFKKFLDDLFHLLKDSNQDEVESVDVCQDQQLNPDVDQLNDCANENNRSSKVYRQVRRRSISDALESLIGLYFSECGIMGSVNCLENLGFRVCHLKEALAEKNISCFQDEVVTSSNYDNYDREIDEFEKMTGYRFQNKYIFDEAFITPGYPVNLGHHGYSHRRLELLGDALLYILCSSILVLDKERTTCGKLSIARSAIVDSKTFATLAALIGFHKFLRFISSSMLGLICKWVEEVKKEEAAGMLWNNKYTSAFVIFGDTDDDKVEVPKVMANVFEAVTAAIFLDSGCNFVRVWEIIGPVLKPVVDYYVENPPLSPVRILNEMSNLYAIYREVDPSESGNFAYEVNIPGIGKFLGEATCRKAAKAVAAQKALVYIEEKQNLKI